MKSIALANPQALFAYAVGVVGSHMCFLYTWSRQGSCGVVPGPRLVFLIAPLNLWTSRDPHTSHDTRRRSEGRRLQRRQSSPCCSYLRPLPNNHSSPNKGQDSGTVHLPFSGTSPALTTMLTNGKRQYVLKPINYYCGLCESKVVTIVCFFIVKLYKLRFFSICFDRDWIFNPMTKCISPCIVQVALM